MSNAEVASLIITLLVFLACLHGFGHLFERLRQPRLVGEILAGVVLGPFVLGRLAPSISTTLFGAYSGTDQTGPALGFAYWFGLMLLMFVSGSGTHALLARENRRTTAIMLGIGTPLSFFLTLGLGLASVLPVQSLMGTAGQPIATLLVLSIGVAVTSIPIISRIFHDLGILHTRFASLILGFAVIEDILLWGVLGIATSFVGSAALTQQSILGGAALHVATALTYTMVGLTIAPALLRRLHASRWNFLVEKSPTAYAVLILLAYCALAGVFEINLVFAAFLAGFGLVGGISGSERQRFANTLDAITKFSFAVFIPIYFGLVGYKLVLGREFSATLLLAYLAGSSLLALLSVGLAARVAGFRGLDFLNLAVVANARGGPGIVLASVAYEAGIINGAFYTTLVLTAVITSQIAGSWLRFVLRRGWPLLSSNPEETWHPQPDRKPAELGIPPQPAGIEAT
ncbi:MAG TPA: cation:proton antiporter [Terriglobia bacterium]|nr:cation:proton antiporter [Terriglobia bacterium]